MNNLELWQSVLAQMQFHISKANFATWFQNTEIISRDNEKIIISVPNAFSKEWLSNKYNKLILKTLRDSDDSIKDVEFIIKPILAKDISSRISAANEKPEEIQLKFDEFKINKETNLNPRYTFSNFVVGSFNELAHAAALAVSDNPGFTYNPLFIYGGTGLGKTHLIQAIGNKVSDDSKKKRVKYFKASLAPIDLLILDDIQFIAGKNKSQEEFFHVFNSLYEKNKQIVLSSDRPPNAIAELEERLRSRFEGGMIADVSLPDYETRLVILKTKLQEKNMDLSEEILDYIATNVKKNIRELEGALNKLLVYNKINQTLDLETVKKLLKGFVFSPFDVANYKKIIETVAKFYNLDEKNLFDVTRRKEIVRPRQVAMFLLRKELKYSFPAIARKFGGKDHTTAIYAYKKILQENEENNKLTEELNLIKQRIYSG
ncbi:MAG: chromosomal replication initiator protein DnaA [Candidatus Staskawiczbacteria bacterium]|nr:chromosomal replication initiator protein DnaA [Candidatus Staskawiczbacteria bacterium]